MSFADLHVHSNHSDGVDPPSAVVDRARAAGVSALALTDHDTVAGVGEGRAAAKAVGMAFLSGVEVSASFGRCEVHVTGLGVDETHPALLERLAHLSAQRRERIGAIVERLQATGIELPREQLERFEQEATPGRLHVARALKHMGAVRRTQQGFDQYLNPGRPAFVPKVLLPADEAIALIHQAGGLAFVAHPGLQKSVRKLLPLLLTLPFDGIEAYHVSHSPGRTGEFLALAKERKLLVSGGSDCHGGMKGKALIGQVRVPLEHFEAVRAAL